jgi:uncharacterized NAD(P)/FAD-binding protein YdhS
VSRRVAVIGGGAAGTLAAVHLLGDADAAGIEVTLIDRDGEFGPGLAYATPNPLHLLNVPAIRMGGISGEPEHFHVWLADRGHTADPEAFVPRGVFGEYLRDLLRVAEGLAGGTTRLDRVQAEVIGLGRTPASGALELRLAGGSRIYADHVVLAVGALPAADPVGITPELTARGVYVADPWAPGALESSRHDESVLVVGTGLTMIDVALALGEAGRGPLVRAVSRHGLLPRAHRPDLTRIGSFPEDGTGSLDGVIATILEQIAGVSAEGGDWRDVIDSMRPHTPAIWRSLSSADQRRFLAGLHRLWDVHRFRMAPEVAERFAQSRRAGRVIVEPASIWGFEPSRRGARVTLRPADRDACKTVDVDRVINCTGPGGDVNRHATPLLADLLATGTARPDRLSLGLDVEEGGRLIDASGAPVPNVHLIGCLRKGVEWEAIGITEIRDQAAATARAVLEASGPALIAG